MTTVLLAVLLTFISYKLLARGFLTWQSESKQAEHPKSEDLTQPLLDEQDGADEGQGRSSSQCIAIKPCFCRNAKLCMSGHWRLKAAQHCKKRETIRTTQNRIMSELSGAALLHGTTHTCKTDTMLDYELTTSLHWAERPQRSAPVSAGKPIVDYNHPSHSESHSPMAYTNSLSEAGKGFSQGVMKDSRSTTTTNPNPQVGSQLE